MPSLRFTVSLVVTGRVADEIDGMRRALGARSLLRIPPHITVVPPLNVPADGVPAVLDQLRAAGEAASPITVDLGGPATFAPRNPVVYLAVGGAGMAAISALRALLVAGVLAPPDGRREPDFVPHVTLDQRAAPERIPVALAALADYRTSFTFTQVTLLEQGPDKAWHPLAAFPLAAPAVRARGGLPLEVAVGGRLDPVSAEWAGAGEEFSVTGRRDGQLVGVAAGVVSSRVCQVTSLVVAPAERRQGIGAHLLQAVESHAAGAGCAVVRAPAPAGGAGAALLAGRGYVAVARVPDPAGGPDRVVFERRV